MRVNDDNVMPSAGTYSFLGMTAVMCSKAMMEVLYATRRAAKSTSAVLITGETGTGKELIARALHCYSSRAIGPFVDLNCAAFPDHLLESELFGYEKGAFSGAESSREGLLETATGGSLFLDEIGELDRRMQAKLLRVLDGAPYYRIGGRRKISVDTRIIAATNSELYAAVEAGTFRSDLFHRLDQIRLSVPPLRYRVDDVEALATHFLEREAPELRLSVAAMDALKRYSWPGNVRELRNTVLKLAVAQEHHLVLVTDLPRHIQLAPEACRERPTLELVEQSAILDALSEAGGRRDRAAHLLGISRRTLSRKLKRYEAPQRRRVWCSS